MEKQKFRRFEENFISWYEKTFEGSVYTEEAEGYNLFFEAPFDRIWENLPIEMKWGVYEDFFERNGIYPEVKDCHGHEVFEIKEVERYHATCCQRKGKYYALVFTDDKKEARKEALDKAIELYETTEVLCNDLMLTQRQ